MVKYLSEILQDTNTIILPGLGALTITNKDTGELVFMQYLKHDDGVLTEYIAKAENIDVSEAKILVAQFVREIQASLDSDELYHMLDFGTFYKDQDGEVHFKNWDNYEQQTERKIVSVPLGRTDLSSATHEEKDSLKALREASTLPFLQKFPGTFWWLNADEAIWPIDDAKEGEIYDYPKLTVTKSGKNIVRNGFNQIQLGDVVITYQKAPEQRLAGVYEVVASKMEDHTGFKFIQQVQRKVTWEELKKLKSFNASAIKSMSATGSLYRLSHEFFIELIQLADSVFNLTENIGRLKEVDKFTPKLPKHTRSEAISTDHGSIDSLGFTKDVQSLAALIALKEMKPPLAIALFGKWGSGKSFFMENLEQRIRELSKYQGFLEKEGESPKQNEEALFLTGIAHIKFNAWSYMDANLWAGLAHSLFEKLDQYINDNTKGDLERDKVHKQMNERLEFLNRDLTVQSDKLLELNKEKAQLEIEREHNLLNWFRGKYDARMRAFLKLTGMEDHEIEGYLPSKLRKHVQKSIDFVKYLKENGKQVSIWFLVIVAGLWGFKTTIAPMLPEIVSFFKSVWTYGSLTIVSPVLIVTHFYLRYKGYISSLMTLSYKEERLKNETSNSNNDDETRREIQNANRRIIELESDIAQVELSKQNLNDRAIENLISEIPGKDDYVKHLGIITTIRKDFETLSDLFAYRDKVVNETLSDKEKERIEQLNEARTEIGNSFEKGRKLNRIVLYIDDLDRCTDEKVLQVLQAVHLLMAFPLFTVVVGVDERSVHNALKYSQLKRYQNIDKDLVVKNIKEIEPREYLEKIFQIPFQLPEATVQGVAQLINAIIPNPLDEKLDESEFVSDVSKEVEPKESKGYVIEDRKESRASSVGESDRTYLTIKTIQPQEIRITSNEKEFLQLFAPLVGNNPRTLKRYVNIFRIVKTHELDIFSEEDATLYITFLIAFYTGKYRLVAGQFFKREHDFRLNAYLSKTAGLAKEKSDEGKLLVLIESMQEKEKGVQQILNMPKADHLKFFGFIERFSYKLDAQIETN